MSNKLFHHAITKSGKKQQTSGRFDWNNNGLFARCDAFPCWFISNIKWLSCCVDQHGSYWNLLPLSGEPVCTFKKGS
ncbi:unnamed protein product [Brassica rapa subsp. trilocularis]